jgi:hypothetical protein
LTFIDHYPWGPTLDKIGGSIPDEPATAFLSNSSQKEFTTSIDSIIISYAEKDGEYYANNAQNLNSSVTFDDLWTNILDPASPLVKDGVVSSISSAYPVASFSSPFSRLAASLQDQHVDCNNLWLHNAYNGVDGTPPWTSVLPIRVWNARTNVGSGSDQGQHGSELGAVLFPGSPPGADGNAYRQLLVNHAVFGDPNGEESTRTAMWPAATSVASGVNNVLTVDKASLTSNTAFPVFTDTRVNAAVCSIWAQIQMTNETTAVNQTMARGSSEVTFSMSMRSTLILGCASVILTFCFLGNS